MPSAGTEPLHAVRKLRGGLQAAVDEAELLRPSAKATGGHRHLVHPADQPRHGTRHLAEVIRHLGLGVDAIDGFDIEPERVCNLLRRATAVIVGSFVR